MKPRTKYERRVLKLSQSLPPLTPYQYKEAMEKHSSHIAKYRTRKEYVCLDCGHTWKGEYAEETICPQCGTKLKVDKSRRKNFQDKIYLGVVSKCQGFQVMRVFLLETFLKEGREPYRDITEIFQRWIDGTGKSKIVGRARNYLSYYCDSWNLHSDMELRQPNYAHEIIPYAIIGHTSVIPEIKRNGFQGDFHGCSPYRLFECLLTDNKIETLWKAGQFKLAKFLMRDTSSLSHYWPTIKIALRHKYIVNDPSIWIDLLRTLNYMNQDLRNPKNVCPTNLNEAHDEWMERRRVKDERQRREMIRRRELADAQRYLEDLKRVEEEETEYKENKSKFFDLSFVDGEITIQPLKSVQEFVEEANLMHHCVFANEYYHKDGVLILHALVDNISVATIEFSLSDFSVIQCRGAYNQKPALYDRIVKLMNDNVSKIIAKTA